MKSPYKLLLLLILPTLLFANNDKLGGKYTKEKKINKEFTVNAKAGLKIDNSYGNLDIVTWNENRTVIEVTITTSGDDEDKVQKKLDDISVEFSGNSSLVTAETIFEKKNNSWNLFGNSHNNISMEINYKIKLPIGNSVDLTNDYGSIILNRIEGNVKITCDYGQLILGELMAENNYLSFDYTDKSTINYMKSGKINADYSGFTLNKADRLELQADYTRSEIKEVNTINYNCDYGKISIDKAGEVMGRGDYLNNNIGSVSGSLNLNTDYGSISIDRVTNTAKDITINADYTGIKFGFANTFNFDFVVNLSYASLQGQNQVTLTKTSIENIDKMYSGYNGRQNSGNTVNIRSDYGGVTFIKN